MAQSTLELGGDAIEEQAQANGCVHVGGAFFLHPGDDPENLNPWNGHLGHEHYFDRVIDGGVPASIAAAMTLSAGDSAKVLRKLLMPPGEPAAQRTIAVDMRAIGVADVNIVDYRRYNSEDPKALAAAQRHAHGRPITSLETTHGVIAATAKHHRHHTPVAFVSGITDALGHFGQDVGGQPQAQDFSAAFNAGVYLGNVLVPLASTIASLT